MDAKKLGLLIAQRRKELGLTQAELAQTLYVTDKAVSKWERGIGLPDVNSIEPLADALGVSISEVVKGERISAPLTEQEASAALKDVLNLAEQKRMEQRKIFYIVGAAALLVFIIFLIDLLGLLGFIGICLTSFGAVAGIVLLICAIWRKMRHLPCTATLVIAILLLCIPVLFMALLAAGFVVGLGPVPN